MYCKLTRRAAGVGTFAAVVMGSLAFFAGQSATGTTAERHDKRAKITVEEIGLGEIETAIASLGLSFTAANALRFDLDDGVRRIGFFHAWDPTANRRVKKASFSAFGVSSAVELTSAPTKVYVLLAQAGTDTMMTVETLSPGMSVGMDFQNDKITTPWRAVPSNFNQTIR